MIKCERNDIVLVGDPVTLVAEFGLISLRLRESLSELLSEETVQSMMDTVYNFRKEGETC